MDGNGKLFVQLRDNKMFYCYLIELILGEMRVVFIALIFRYE